MEIRDCNSSRPASARSAAAVSVGQSSQKELIDAEEGVDQNEEENLPKVQNLKMSENLDYHLSSLIKFSSGEICGLRWWDVV